MLFQKIKSIHVDELTKLLEKEKAVVVDVREKDEYAMGHIPNAINHPLSNIEQLTLTQPAYIICHSGMRSQRASKYLSKKGYDVTNVSGGMSAYKGKVVR